MDYFKKLDELLKIEKQEDQQQFSRQSQTLSIADKRANGVAWFPIAIRDTEIGRGDYLTVEVERTTHQELPHQLRFGAAAILFSNHNKSEYILEGVITFQGGNKLKISLRADELPDWTRDGKLGIELLFDNNSYEEMQQAIKLAAARLEKNDDATLIRILTGEKKPEFHDSKLVVKAKNLNDSQIGAVYKIIQANELAIVHGPPGTGKTTTLVQAIKGMYQQDHKQILVTAPSNTAVDLLSQKLSEEGLNVLRVGNPARVSEQLMSLTLDSKMQAHGSMKEMKKLKKQANEFRNMAHKYKRNFGKAERDQRKALFDEARNIMKTVERTEQYIVDDLLAKAEIITATLVGTNHYTVKHLEYHTVVIDEAGQALEPACWIPVLKAKKLVLAGDHFQLSPTIKSDEAANKGLRSTLFEKNINLHPEAVTLLDVQYRMHQKIMGYSSQVFYENKLRADQSVANHLLFAEDEPFLFIDTAGCGFDEKAAGTSVTNPEEAAFLLNHLLQLVTKLKDFYPFDVFPTIAVISPYKQQIEILKEQLLHIADLNAFLPKIAVNTIDSFQGQERDIVYISMTRSNTDNIIGFLNDIRRMNVAMTRARKKLVIIGDGGTLGNSPFYAGMIDYAEKLNNHLSAWEFMEL
ncbi:MAG TPA: AAA domain-containing protein [Flavitalea sp.]|nr:AAA domain-containing protein [Flavitalea sp.]